MRWTPTLLALTALAVSAHETAKKDAEIAPSSYSCSLSAGEWIFRKTRDDGTVDLCLRTKERSDEAPDLCVNEPRFSSQWGQAVAGETQTKFFKLENIAVSTNQTSRNISIASVAEAWRRGNDLIAKGSVERQFARCLVAMKRGRQVPILYERLGDGFKLTDHKVDVTFSKISICVNVIYKWSNGSITLADSPCRISKDVKFGDTFIKYKDAHHWQNIQNKLWAGWSKTELQTFALAYV